MLLLLKNQPPLPRDCIAWFSDPNIKEFVLVGYAIQLDISD
jgi:hypothetical protein